MGSEAGEGKLVVGLRRRTYLLSLLGRSIILPKRAGLCEWCGGFYSLYTLFQPCWVVMFRKNYRGDKASLRLAKQSLTCSSAAGMTVKIFFLYKCIAKRDLRTLEDDAES